MLNAAWFFPDGPKPVTQREQSKGEFYMTTRERNEIRRRRKVARLMKQKLLGLMTFLASLVVLYLSVKYNVDGTAYMVLAPFGLLMMFSKRRWIQ